MGAPLSLTLSRYIHSQIKTYPLSIKGPAGALRSHRAKSVRSRARLFFLVYSCCIIGPGPAPSLGHHVSQRNSQSGNIFTASSDSSIHNHFLLTLIPCMLSSYRHTIASAYQWVLHTTHPLIPWCSSESTSTNHYLSYPISPISPLTSFPCVGTFSELANLMWLPARSPPPF